MIVLMCNNCDSTNLKKYEGKMSDKGHDWVTCKDCGKSTSMRKCGCREEMDCFD